MTRHTGNSSSSAIVMDRVCLSVGPTQILRDVNLSIGESEFHVLLGPSGAGKTSILRAIAGFVRVQKGRLDLFDRTVATPSLWVPPEDRHVGVVFQDYALFPHLTVRGNVAFAIDTKKDTAPDIAGYIEDLLYRVGLKDKADCSVEILSGGEKQRVALARVLAQRPSIVVLDEPFSSVDFSMRKELMDLTETQLRHAKTTAVYVTHDVEEAMRLGDRVSVVQDGRIVATGTPRDLYCTPPLRQVALAFGDWVRLPIITVAEGRVQTPLGWLSASSATGSQVTEAWCRKHQLRVASEGEGAQGKVTRVVFLGSHWEVTVSVANYGTVSLHRDSSLPPLTVGSVVVVQCLSPIVCF